MPPDNQMELTRFSPTDAARPDCDKLLSVAEVVRAVNVPAVSPAAMAAAEDVLTVLREAEQLIRDIVKGMV